MDAIFLILFALVSEPSYNSNMQNCNYLGLQKGHNRLHVVSRRKMPALSLESSRWEVEISSFLATYSQRFISFGGTITFEVLQYYDGRHHYSLHPLLESYVTP